MNREDAVRTLRVAGVGVAGALGGGLLFVPERVAPTAGPVAPAAFLLAGGAFACVAAAFAVLRSGPFGTGRGLVYRAVSRTWGSRAAGVVAAWPAVAAYVALLALLANWFGHLGTLPPDAAAWISGVGPTGPVSAVEIVVGPLPDLPAGPIGAAACALALGVHLLGPRRAVTAVAVPVWTLLVALVAALLLAFVPGVGEFVPGNYDPPFPTDDLRRAPFTRFARGLGTALFAFLGVEAAASVDVGGWSRSNDGRSTGGPDASAGVLLAVLAVGLVTALATFVSLGVVNWIRLTLADVPTADALAAYLPVDPALLTAAGSLLLGWTALVALGFPASRTLAGFSELAGDDTSVEPVTAGLVVCYGAAAAICLLGAVAPALYIAVPGLAISYLAVVLTAGALPWRRPDLWAECGLRPGRRLRVALAGGGVPVAVSVLGVALVRDPSVVLSWTLHRVALTVLGFDLVRDPLESAVPAVLAWELVGLGLLFVLRDYREARGVRLPPLSGSGGEP
ncbi:hypothetical protein HUG10_03980 [Halorarum halophilum]|uniref:Amino acid transporter n=1 Tax=Halorarum halophilum TaxID=2743090 RepID=A0A7D5K6I6_9EURY|nr:hypothetical protein [Halobaculum halophilum]QLG26754.1 hypothetical protein HUG10_03980 [Halobaculum halophilum]